MVNLKLNVPTDFFNEEIRNGYRVTHNVKELWAVELDLLVELDRVCQKHGIHYVVSGGTLLGAVRHHGFIPWDDDIDVMMMRDQYERLCEVAKQEFRNPYFFQTEENDPGFMRRFARLRNSQTTGIIKWEYPLRPTFNQGIFIDIFPLDAVTSKTVMYKKQCRDERKYLGFFSFSNMIERNSYPYTSQVLPRITKQILHRIIGPIFRLLGVCHYLYGKIQQNCQLYNKEGCEYVSLLSFQIDNLDWMVRRSSLEDVIHVPFEFVKVPIIKKYDEHLKRKYGDYMTPQKAPSCHGELIFDTTQSYIDYYRKNK